MSYLRGRVLWSGEVGSVCVDSDVCGIFSSGSGNLKERDGLISNMQNKATE